MGAKKSHLEEVLDYCNDVEKGKILANRWVKLACKRTLNDFKNSIKDDFPFYFDEKEANKVIDFAQATKQYEGEWKGKCLNLLPWQKHILMNVYGWKNKKDNYRRYRKAFIQVGRKQGKALALDTPIYTPSGWRTMGDIHEGDYVYGDDGKPVKVLWESDIHLNHDCYKLTFSNGDEIVADADHLWTVRRCGIKRTYNTETLYNLKSGWSDKRYKECPFRVPKAKPLQGVEEMSPLHHKGSSIIIKDIEKVESVPTKCIAVDNESHLFCVGKHNTVTHNSTMISAVLLYDLLMTAGAQVYAACTKRETAKIIYNHCKETIRQNKALANRLRVYASTARIVNEKNAGFLEALPYDPDRMDGLNPSVCCIDEVASMDDHSIIQRLQSGMGARPEGLIFEISSASDNVNSVGADEFKQAKDILEGVIHTDESESFFCIMYCLDDGDDWTDESKYIKANPSLGHTVSADFLHKQRLEAERNPFLQGEFKTRNLGLYVAPMKAWIQPKVWNTSLDNSAKYKVDFNKPYYAVGAVDLSKRSDLTAFTVCIYQQEKYFLFHKAYFPIQMMEEKLKKDSAMWRKWTEDGILTATEGSVVDYRQLFIDIMEAYEKYNLECVLFDPYNSNSLITELQENIDLVEVPQNLKNLSPFTKRFEEEIYRGNIVDSNPLMRWQMSHAEVYRDANENMKIVKPDSKNSGKRIDNVITSLMCVGRIGSLLDEGEIDLRSNEDVEMQTASFLKGLNIYG